MSLFGSPVESEIHWIDLPFLSIDTETTGLNSKDNRIIEIAWVKYERQSETEKSSFLCHVDTPLPSKITEITGITKAMLDFEKPFSTYVDQFLEAIASVSYIVAYNANFDRGFVAEELKRAGRSMPNTPWVDPLVVVKQVDQLKRGNKLGEAATRWGITASGAHRALADALTSAQLLCKLAPRIKPTNLKDLLAQQKVWQEEQDRSFRAYR